MDDFTLIYMDGFYDGEKKWKDRIRGKVKKLEDMKITTRKLYGKTINEQIYKFAQDILEEILEE